MAKVKLSPPWVIHYQKLAAFFKHDKEIHVLYDEEEKHIKLYINNDIKASALGTLLKTEVEFGNVTLTIEIVRPNIRQIPLMADTKSSIINAFDKNDAFDFMAVAEGIFTNPLIYVVFKPEIVQYWTDDLGDYNGLHTTLFQEIAKEIFVEIPNVCYCTNKIDDTQSPVFGGRLNSCYP